MGYKPENITIFVLPYLGICAVLYHVAYWGTFGINGLSYITLSNLLTSSIYPIITTAGFTFVFLPILDYITYQKGFLQPGEGRNTVVGKKLNSKSGLIISFILWIVLSFYLYYNGTESRWFLWPWVVSSLPWIITQRSTFGESIITNHSVRSTVIRFIILLPAYSFAIGKYDSERIYKNIEYHYIQLTRNSGSIWLKYIGTTENSYIFQDINNESIMMLAIDKCDTISFIKFSK